MPFCYRQSSLPFSLDLLSSTFIHCGFTNSYPPESVTSTHDGQTSRQSAGRGWTLLLPYIFLSSARSRCAHCSSFGAVRSATAADRLPTSTTSTTGKSGPAWPSFPVADPTARNVTRLNSLVLPSGLDCCIRSRQSSANRFTWSPTWNQRG